MLSRITMLSMLLPALLFMLNTSQAQDRAKPEFVEGDPLFLVHGKSSNEYLAYSKLAGKWNRFTFPEGIEASPVMATGVCAFVLKGDAVSELVAVDRMGNWCKTKLSAPVQECSPIIDNNMAVFHINGMVYAFSAELGKWDSVESPDFPFLTNESALVITPDYVAAFSVKTGRWAVAKTAQNLDGR